MKKFLYIFFSVLCLSFLILAVFTIKSYGVSDFSYTLDSAGNATITAYNGNESDLTIPSTIDGHNVVTIGEHAFDVNRNTTNGDIIKNLVISEGISKIDGWAFCKCENLETVKLPESLRVLDWQIFLGCEKLREINIPHNLTYLNNGFLEQTAIEEITIPENIQEFLGQEFRLCDYLKKVYIYNDNINYYNNGFDTRVFEGCDSVVLYGNEGSTTQAYAQQQGIEFRLLSSIEPPAVTGSIHLNKNELSLKVDESETLTVTFNEIPQSTEISWSSSDPDIVTVENGKVTAKGKGNAVITVMTADGNYKDTCNITVVNKDEPIEPTEIPITSIKLNKTSLTLNIGKNETLIATITPSDATEKNLIWSSSDSDIATVENGKITAKEAGTAIITVSNADGTQKATCNVTVVNKGTIYDNTIADKILPLTGVKMVVIILIGVIIAVASIIYNKYNKYKDVK